MSTHMHRYMTTIKNTETVISLDKTVNTWEPDLNSAVELNEQLY